MAASPESILLLQLRSVGLRQTRVSEMCSIDLRTLRGEPKESDDASGGMLQEQPLSPFSHSFWNYAFRVLACSAI